MSRKQDAICASGASQNGMGSRGSARNRACALLQTRPCVKGNQPRCWDDSALLARRLAQHRQQEPQNHQPSDNGSDPHGNSHILPVFPIAVDVPNSDPVLGISRFCDRMAAAPGPRPILANEIVVSPLTPRLSLGSLVSGRAGDRSSDHPVSASLRGKRCANVQVSWPVPPAALPCRGLPHPARQSFHPVVGRNHAGARPLLRLRPGRHAPPGGHAGTAVLSPVSAIRWQERGRRRPAAQSRLRATRPEWSPYAPARGRYPGRALTRYLFAISDLISTVIRRKPSFGFGAG